MILNERTLNNGLFKRRKASEDIKGKISDWDIWECADPTFSYAYDRTVTMYVHEGAVALTFSNGETVDLQSSDTLTIQSGAIADWIITAPVRNSYVYHDQRLPAVNLGP
jgi:uncharacterized cupin superfamily protein